MSLQITSFTTDHLEAAASLLAARHRRDRAAFPALPDEFEEAEATLPLLRDLLTAEGATGVVALDSGRLVGYLIGSVEVGSPTRAFAGFMHPRAADIAYAGHAVAAPGDAVLTSRLYAALAQHWLRRGLTGHYVSVPLCREASEPWWELGFGQFIALGVRSTAVGDEPVARPQPDLEIRQATADDEGLLQDAMTGFMRTFAEAPIFVPFLDETAAERRRFVAEHLTQPGSPVWLAFTGGQFVGFQMFEEPSSPHWHLAPLETPPRSLYLQIAYTTPEGRGTGVGAALLRHNLAWARDAGYDTCIAEWVTSSRAAPFWRGQGFQPVSCWMCRAVDPRATWADGRT
jgi:GNAT superfamily N-acetyltransferase